MIPFIQIVLMMTSMVFTIPILNKIRAIVFFKKALQFYLLNEAANPAR